MNNDSKFQRYQRIKKQLTYNYKGYPVEKIIAMDLLIGIYGARKFTIKSLAAYIIKGTLPLYVSTLNLEELRFNEPSKTLFSMGMWKRKDYYEIWDHVKSQIKSHVSFDFSTQETKFKLNLKNIFKSLYIVNHSKELSLLNKLRLSAQTTYYLNIIDDLEKAAPVVGKYCALSSIQDYETILTCYFKKKGVKTFSLQHGVYAIFKKHIPLESILYENLVSDYHLCWGQSTKEEFEEYGINKDSLIVAGYPRKTIRPPLPDRLIRKECLVFLARYSYHDSNLKLVEILKKIKEKEEINISLKLHPSLHWKKYKSVYEEIASQKGWKIIPQDTTITELFENNIYGWAIAVNTSVYYESYIYNLPCLRFNDGSFDDTVDIMEDKFTNFKELVNCLNVLPFNDSKLLPSFFQKVDERLDYALGINTSKYGILNT